MSWEDEVEVGGVFEGARSWLFVPGHLVDRWLAMAADSEADVLILDLEDAVAPARKDEAREAVRAALNDGRYRQPVVVRINGITTRWWRDDVAMVAGAGAAAVMQPKVAVAREVEALASALVSDTSGLGHPSSRPAIVPLIETASGVLHAEAIASAVEVVAVAFGGEDLAANLGVMRSETGVELEHARGHVTLACAAAGRVAIDTPTLNTSDLSLVHAQAVAAKTLGFNGKLAIHPRQVAAINAAFEPDAAEIRRAMSVINGFEEAQRAGLGIVVIEGQMVDKPVVVAAQRLIARSTTGRSRPIVGKEA